MVVVARILGKDVAGVRFSEQALLCSFNGIINAMDYKAVWRDRTREWAIDLLGGACVACGATEDLDFDHVIPGSQEFRISEGIRDGYSRARLLVELQKCQLLCHGSCHNRKSAENNETGGGWNRIDEHGTEAFHDREGCRCDPCVKAKWTARLRRGQRRTEESQNVYGGRGRYGTVTEHGAGGRGIKGCKCDLCRAARARTMREYRRSQARDRGVSG